MRNVPIQHYGQAIGTWGTPDVPKSPPQQYTNKAYQYPNQSSSPSTTTRMLEQRYNQGLSEYSMPQSNFSPMQQSPSQQFSQMMPRATQQQQRMSNAQKQHMNRKNSLTSAKNVGLPGGRGAQPLPPPPPPPPPPPQAQATNMQAPQRSLGADVEQRMARSMSSPASMNSAKIGERYTHLKRYSNAESSHIDNHASANALKAMKGSPQRDYVHERSLKARQEKQRKAEENNYGMRRPGSMVDARLNKSSRNPAAHKELDRRSLSPAYQIQSNMQGRDWNGDAQVSQRELNDMIHRERMAERSEEIVWNRIREDAWDDSTQDPFRDRRGQKVPLRPMEGLLPVGSGTADPIMVKRLRSKSGSSFIPKMNSANIRGRVKDEQTLMKMFRSFDDNYDGQLQTTEFRNALRYMGAKDIHSLMKELDPEGTGEINYSDAINALQIKPGNSHTFKTGRITVEPVPPGERPLASDRNIRDGELGKTAYSSLPWATAGMHAKHSEVSKMVQIQLLNREDKEGGVKYMEGQDLDTLRSLQEKLRSESRGSATRLKAALRVADRDRDGALSYDDFFRTLRTSLGMRFNKAEMRDLTRHFDAAGSGQIDYYNLTDVLSRTAPREGNLPYSEKEKQKENTFSKLRDGIRGRAWKYKDLLKSLDEEQKGYVSHKTLMRGLGEMGVRLDENDQQVLRSLTKGMGNKYGEIKYSDFVDALDRPMKSHESHIGSGMTPIDDFEDADYVRRNKTTIYQENTNNKNYSYLNSGFLSKEQKIQKQIMQKVMQRVMESGSTVYGDDGPLNDDLRACDYNGDGEITNADFKKVLHKHTEVGLSNEETKFLIEKLGGDDKGHVRVEDFQNLLRHEYSELKRRPHLTSHIGIYNGSWNIGYQNKSALQQHTKRVYHDYKAMKQYNRSDLLDHYDHQGKTNDGRINSPTRQGYDSGANGKLSEWIPKTQEEVKLMRKMGDVVSARKAALQRRLASYDNINSGKVSVNQFTNALANECSHLFRSQELNWVVKKLEKNKDGYVKYNDFFNALSQHGAFSTSSHDKTVDGFKITSPGGNSWRGMNDRHLVASLGAKTPKPKVAQGTESRYKDIDSKQRLDPWGRPLNIAPAMRTAEQKRFEKHGHFGGHSGKVVYDNSSHNVQNHIKAESPNHFLTSSISFGNDNNSYRKSNLNVRTTSTSASDTNNKNKVRHNISPSKIVRCKIGPPPSPPKRF